MTLTEEDLKYIERLKEVEIFQNVDDHLLDQTNGLILVTCGDGDQMFDIFKYHVQMQNGHLSDPRIHLLAFNGGASRLSRNSPTNRPGFLSDLTFMEGIHEAVALKGIRTIGLQIHGPCGKIARCGLTFKQSLPLLIEAKLRVKSEIANSIVACLCHIDYGNHKKRTEFVNRPNFEKWHHLL